MRLYNPVDLHYEKIVLFVVAYWHQLGMASQHTPHL